MKNLTKASLHLYLPYVLKISLIIIKYQARYVSRTIFYLLGQVLSDALKILQSPECCDITVTNKVKD